MAVVDVDVRDIEVRIWDEIDSGLTETRVIRLERGQDLCVILESMRALVLWYEVCSINFQFSPVLNVRPWGSSPTQTRFLVNEWGERLFSRPNRGHVLRLHLWGPLTTVERRGRVGRGAAGAGKPARGA